MISQNEIDIENNIIDIQNEVLAVLKKHNLTNSRAKSILHSICNGIEEVVNRKPLDITFARFDPTSGRPFYSDADHLSGRASPGS